MPLYNVLNILPDRCLAHVDRKVTVRQYRESSKTRMLTFDKWRISFGTSSEGIKMYNYIVTIWLYHSFHEIEIVYYNIL